MAETSSSSSIRNTSKKNAKSTSQKSTFTPSFAADDDPFALIAGGEEGGFLSLEEIDEVDYELLYGISEKPLNLSADSKSKKSRSKSKKKKTEVDDSVDEKEEKATVTKNKKKKAKYKKKKKTDIEKSGGAEDDEEPCPELIPISTDKTAKIHTNTTAAAAAATDGELLLNDDEVSAWNVLRLHPLLIKSIRRLGFKEPTPIQKACIPAAAHSGKDVIGAAETGSGKTLAFGLPILQRLLEEREKAFRFITDEAKPAEIVKRGGPLRALIITPTRELAKQVCSHIREAAKNMNIGVESLIGGMSVQKQERILKRRPEIVVGTPGRLWERMIGGNEHLTELHSLSFFVLDEADKMIETGHFKDLQNIIDMLPTAHNYDEQSSSSSQSCGTTPKQKKRQTFVFSATLALSDDFHKKLKRPSISKSAAVEDISSIQKLSERAGIRPNAAIVDLTTQNIVADKVEESFIECREEDKDAYLYYILSVHGQGQTIVFATSIAALRHISSLLRILGVNALTCHGEMQQKARIKAVERFSNDVNGVLVATDVAARGLDIPGIRTVIHYQLPHSADVYIHRSGRTARASSDGCSIALISSKDKAKFISLCKSMKKETLRQFPLVESYLPEVMKRMSLARQIDKISRKNTQENVKKNWLKRSAESLDLTVEESGSEEETVTAYKQKRAKSGQLKNLQQELSFLLTQPLQPKNFSRRYLLGTGISFDLQKQLEQLTNMKEAEKKNPKEKQKTKFSVLGQQCIEPLQALRNSGHEVSLIGDKTRDSRQVMETLKRKRKEEKKKMRDERRKKRKQMKEEKLNNM